ncbi:Tubulin alpha chain [Symbiodinium microadriaticum]|uniref:Tubulin alpha chain n=1 Tax=Symbiodinium microadriaticum TaxID=2951 RepID=A0A1Q9F0D0_SYMMI|nr:Tubulin alpha chain [Symbiodinium microadriaticum]
MARHGNWVRDEPAREPIQVLTQDLVDHAVAVLFEHGAVSLKALRLFLQRRTGTNLISMRSRIRQLAEQTVESMTGGLDVKTLPAQGLEEIRKTAVWEPVPVDLEKHDRGRCLFESLNDHCGDSAESCGNQGDVQIGNPFWELFCLERGIQPDGQVPLAQTVGDDDGAFTTSFPVTGGARGMMVDLWPMVADDVYTGTCRRLLHTELTELNETFTYWMAGDYPVYIVGKHLARASDECYPPLQVHVAFDDCPSKVVNVAFTQKEEEIVASCRGMSGDTLADVRLERSETLRGLHKKVLQELRKQLPDMPRDVSLTLIDAMTGQLLSPPPAPPEPDRKLLDIL